jgi:heptosyltransferase-3
MFLHSTQVPPPRRILIMAMRCIGDVLLATPLAEHLQRRWPEVQLDWVVNAGTEGVLQNNPVAHQVFSLPVGAGTRASWQMLKQVFQRYDLAFSTQGSDRETLLARAAAPRAYGFSSGPQVGSLRDRLLTKVVARQGGHKALVVMQLLQLLPAEENLGDTLPHIVPPQADFQGFELPPAPYVVLHAAGSAPYKNWHKMGWRALIKRLQLQGFAVACTGGPGATEKAYLDHLFEGLNVWRMDGLLRWPQVSALLLKARAFVDIDTSVTHLAASLNVPTVALFGPTNPTVWGPWSSGPARVHWQARGPLQQQGCVTLLQNEQDCVPCFHQGCDKHAQSHARCLDELPLERVWLALQAHLSLRT